MDENEICVPTSALSMPDEQESMEAPEAGDIVQFNGEGKVTRIEGENSYVKLTAINGSPLKEDGSAQDEPGGDPESPDEGGLEKMAADLDQNNTY